MEKWVDIKGFEGLYQVSNYGRVKSMNYNSTGKEKIMSGNVDKYGYRKVTLTNNKKKYSKMVHRLVADAFIPNPSNLPSVNHKDEVKTNNFVENLEWCTVSYNNSYGKRLERLSKTKTNGKTSKKVYQYTIDGVLIKVWDSANECGRNGFRTSHVSACCLRKPHSNTHKGYKWSYEPL